MRVFMTITMSAVLAAPICATEYPPDRAELNELSGTSWEMIESGGERIIWNLEPNGVLSYKSNSGFWRNGSWKQIGDQLYLETNNKYYEAFGTIMGDHAEGGQFWNRAGLKGTWTGRRSEPAYPPGKQ
ncbi:MAG TPA: hypothetical protein VKS79_06470 [Gemmataceae bacterium]|nr:hypothetical protein [Gemmataceae bacterium]